MLVNRPDCLSLPVSIATRISRHSPLRGYCRSQKPAIAWIFLHFSGLLVIGGCAAASYAGDGEVPMCTCECVNYGVVICTQQHDFQSDVTIASRITLTAWVQFLLVRVPL